MLNIVLVFDLINSLLAKFKILHPSRIRFRGNEQIVIICSEN